MKNHEKLMSVINILGLDSAKDLQQYLNAMRIKRSLNTIQGWMSNTGNKGGSTEKSIPSPILRLLKKSIPADFSKTWGDCFDEAGYYWFKPYLGNTEVIYFSDDLYVYRIGTTEKVLPWEFFHLNFGKIFGPIDPSYIVNRDQKSQKTGSENN